jgi:hypothetical protein
MSLYSRGGILLRLRRRGLNARALKAWGAAAELVWTRSEFAREADRDRRAGAFAACLVALDAEAATAATLAVRRPPAGR